MPQAGYVPAVQQSFDPMTAMLQMRRMALEEAITQKQMELLPLQKEAMTLNNAFDKAKLSEYLSTSGERRQLAQSEIGQREASTAMSKAQASALGQEMEWKAADRPVTQAMNQAILGRTQQETEASKAAVNTAQEKLKLEQGHLALTQKSMAQQAMGMVLGEVAKGGDPRLAADYLRSQGYGDGADFVANYKPRANDPMGVVAFYLQSNDPTERELGMQMWDAMMERGRNVNIAMHGTEVQGNQAVMTRNKTTDKVASAFAALEAKRKQQTQEADLAGEMSPITGALESGGTEPAKPQTETQSDMQRMFPETFFHNQQRNVKDMTYKQFNQLERVPSKELVFGETPEASYQRSAKGTVMEKGLLEAPLDPDSGLQHDPDKPGELARNEEANAAGRSKKELGAFVAASSPSPGDTFDQINLMNRVLTRTARSTTTSVPTIIRALASEDLNLAQKARLRKLVDSLTPEEQALFKELYYGPGGSK